MSQLILRQKIIQGNADYYEFITSDNLSKQLILNHMDSLKLINQYESRNRNCKVSGNVIGLKAGQGRLPVRIIKAKQKTNQKDDSIKLITKTELIKALNPRTVIYSNDKAFRKLKYNTGFINRYSNIIYDVDRAIIIDDKLLKIQTPYGITSVDDLSTGCKTLLNICYIFEAYEENDTRAVVNVNECGNNILEKIFDIVEGTSIYLYISHDTTAVDDRHKFILNGSKLEDEMQFTEAVWGE